MLLPFFIALSGTCDSFICGFILGVSKIKLTRMNCLILSIFPLLFSIISVSIGKNVSMYCTKDVEKSVSIITFLVLGIYTYYEQQKMTMHRWIEKQEWVDIDKNRILSFKELLPLAIVLSVDTLIIALPLSFYNYSILYIATLFGVCSYLTLRIGYLLSTIFSPVESSRILSFSWVIFISLALFMSF